MPVRDEYWDDPITQDNIDSQIASKLIQEDYEEEIEDKKKYPGDCSCGSVCMSCLGMSYRDFI